MLERGDRPEQGPDQPGGVQAGFSEVTRLLREVLLRSDDVGKRLLDELDVGATDLAAMQHLLLAGPMGPAEIARRIHITSASATVLVDRLESAGHVERRSVPGDRRRRTVAPTASAAARIREAVLPLIEEVDDVLDGFGEDERAVVERYLRAVLEAYGRYLTSPAGRAGRPAGRLE